MTSGSVSGWRFRQRRQHRCLCDVDLIDGAAEEVSARCLDPINAITHVNDVEVELEDLLLGEGVLDEPRESELGELLPQRARRILSDGESVARHLHRDGAESFARAPSANVGDDCAEESAPIETAVLVEASVLGRDEGLLDELRYGLQGDVDSSDNRESSHQAIVPVKDATALIGLERLDVACGRTPVEAAGAQPDISEVNR